MYWTPIDSKDLNWNFEKFLIGTDGRPYKRYHPVNEPESLVDDIRILLGASNRADGLKTSIMFYVIAIVLSIQGLIKLC